MIEVPFLGVVVAVVACVLGASVAREMYYYRKYRDAASEEDRIQGFFWRYLPGLHTGSVDDFYMLLKWGWIVLGVIAILYGLLFKLPLPFVGKPLFSIEKPG